MVWFIIDPFYQLGQHNLGPRLAFIYTYIGDSHKQKQTETFIHPKMFMLHLTACRVPCEASEKDDGTRVYAGLVREEVHVL